MSEHTTPQSPERTLRPSMQDALSPDAMEAFRQKQWDALYERQKTNIGLPGRPRNIAETQNEFMAGEVSELHTNYLADAAEASGETLDDETAAKYRRLLVDYQITPGGKGDQWAIPNDEGLTTRQRYERDYNALFGINVPETSGTATTDTDEAEPVSPEIAEARSKYDAAKEKLVAATVKKQSKAFSFKKESYETARGDYTRELRELAALELQDTLNAVDDEGKPLTAEQKNAIVVKYLLERQSELRKETVEGLKDTKVGKFVDFMGRGTKWQRIRKHLLVGAGVGFIAGAAGAGIGLLSVGVGAGAAAATVAAAGGRVVRGYAVHANKSGYGMVETAHLTDSEKEATTRGSEHGTIAAVANRLDEKFNQDTRKEQAKRRRSLGFGLGMAALGGGAGALVGYGLTEAAGVGFRPTGSGDWIKEHVIGGFREPIESADTLGSYNNLGQTDEIDAFTPNLLPYPEETLPNGGVIGPDDAQYAAELRAMDTVDLDNYNINQYEHSAHADVIDTPVESSEVSDPTPANGESSEVPAEASEALTSAELDHINEWIANEHPVIERGDNIWTYAEQYLQANGTAHPSDTEINALKDAIKADWIVKGHADTNGWIYAGDIIKTN